MTTEGAATTATPAPQQSDKLMDRLPKPIRQFFELIGILSALGTLVGWIASTFSLFGRMQFWAAAWTSILRWAVQLPDWVSTSLDALGSGAHWAHLQYRGLIYPLFHWAFRWLPFELPPWAIDVVSIAAFGVFGFLRIYAHSQKEGVPNVFDRPISFALSGGLLAPVMLVQAPFLVICSWFLNRFGPRQDWIQDKLPGWVSGTIAILIATPFTAGFPLSVLLVEWIYVSFHN